MDVVCYDEQPRQAGVMFRQIERWCTGGYQIFREFFPELISGKNGVRRIQQFDTLMLLLMGPCSWISAVISWINQAVMLWNLPLFFFAPFAFSNLFNTICIYIGVASVLKYNHISRRKIGIPAIVTFPAFLFVYMLCSIKTCFVPTKRWTKIEHQPLDVGQS